MDEMIAATIELMVVSMQAEGLTVTEIAEQFFNLGHDFGHFCAGMNEQTTEPVPTGFYI